MAGRPKANIDWKKVDQYLQAQCNSQGIASLLGIAEDTLRRRCVTDRNMNYSEYCRLKKAEGLDMLRAMQYSAAMSGDKTMLVWLGKQYLEQHDKHESKITHDDIETEYDVRSRLYDEGSDG